MLPEFVESQSLKEFVGRLDRTEAARRLHHIANAPSRKRRLRIGAASLGIVVVALVSALVVGQRLGEGRFRCQGFEERMSSVWSGEVEDNLRVQFDAIGRGPTWELARSRIEQYSEQWISTATTACEATWKHGEHTPELLDLMMACFDRRLDELQALIDVFAMDPEGVADRAVLAVHALSPVDVCVNAQLLTAEIPLPRTAGVRVEAHSIGLQLARVKALHDAGAYSETAAEVKGLAGVVDNLDHPPLTAEHRFLSGLLKERLWSVDEASRFQEDGVLAVVAGRHDRQAAKARVRTVWLRGVLRSDFEEAMAEAARADAEIQRISGDLGLEGALENHLAIVSIRWGRFDEAIERCFDALDLRRRAHGERHPLAASTKQNCALMLQDVDRLDESLRLAEEAFAMRLETLGPDHPVVFHSLESLSMLLDLMDRKEEAAGFRDLAVELAERVLPPGHPNLGILKSNLASDAIAVLTLVGGGYLGQERFEDARIELQAALEAAERTNAGDWRITVIRFRLAVSLYHLGDAERARALFTQVKTTSEGRDDPWFGEIATETDDWLAATT